VSTGETTFPALKKPAVPKRVGPIARVRRMIVALRAPRDRGPMLYRLLCWCCRNSR